jgi:hypothetical protein
MECWQDALPYLFLIAEEIFVELLVVFIYRQKTVSRNESLINV